MPKRKKAKPTKNALTVSANKRPRLGTVPSYNQPTDWFADLLRVHKTPPDIAVLAVAHQWRSDVTMLLRLVIGLIINVKGSDGQSVAPIVTDYLDFKPIHPNDGKLWCRVCFCDNTVYDGSCIVCSRCIYPLSTGKNCDTKEETCRVDDQCYDCTGYLCIPHSEMSYCALCYRYSCPKCWSQYHTKPPGEITRDSYDGECTRPFEPELGKTVYPYNRDNVVAIAKAVGFYNWTCHCRSNQLRCFIHWKPLLCWACGRNRSWEGCDFDPFSHSPMNWTHFVRMGWLEKPAWISRA